MVNIDNSFQIFDDLNLLSEISQKLLQNFFKDIRITNISLTMMLEEFTFCCQQNRALPPFPTLQMFTEGDFSRRCCTYMDQGFALQLSDYTKALNKEQMFMDFIERRF